MPFLPYSTGCKGTQTHTLPSAALKISSWVLSLECSCCCERRCPPLMFSLGPFPLACSLGFYKFSGPCNLRCSRPECGGSVLRGRRPERTGEKKKAVDNAKITLRHSSCTFQRSSCNSSYNAIQKEKNMRTCPLRSCRVPLPWGWSAAHSPM